MKRLAPAIKHPASLAIVTLIALLVLFFWPAVFTGHVLVPTDVIFQVDPLWQPLAPDDFVLPRNRLLSDQAYQFYPWKRYLVTSLAEGRLPLWNPYINGGQPFLANAQTAIFSPFTLVSLLFPLNASFAVVTLSCLFVAGFSTYLLAREIGVGTYGALAAMIAFTFSGPLIVWPGHPHTQAIAWLPLLLLLTERAFSRSNSLYVLAAGAVVGAQFLAGHPETSFHVILVWLLFATWRAVALFGAEPRRLIAPATKILAAGLIGGLASAIQLLPFLRFLLHSDILAARAGAANPTLLSILFLDWHQWPTAITALLPQLFGSPVDDSYWYPYCNYNEQTFYVGVLPLVLSIVAIGTAWKGHGSLREKIAARPLLAFFLGLAILSCGLALRFPILNLINHLPVFNLAYNARLRNVYALAVAILAGFGLERIIESVSQEHRERNRFPLRALVITATVIGIAGLVIALASYGGIVVLEDRIIALGKQHAETVHGGPLYPYPLEHYYNKVEALYQKMRGLFRPRNVAMYLPPVIGGLTLLLSKRMRRSLQRPNIWAGILISLIALDLFIVGVGYNPTLKPEEIYPTPEAVRFLQQDTTIYRVAGIGMTLMPNSNMVYDLQDARGYDAVAPRRYTALFDRMEGSARITLFWLLENAGSPLLDLLNVKYVLTRENLGGRWTRVWTDENGMHIYLNQAVMPRAFIVHQVEYVGDAEASLARMTDGSFDYRTGVVLEGTPIDGLDLPDEPPPSPGEAHITWYRPEYVEVQTFSSVDGLLVLTDGYDAGWKVEVDGEPAEVHVANHAFRAVGLPAGAHTITFCYDPAEFKIGLWVSLGTWITLAVSAIGLTLVARGQTSPGGDSCP